MSNILKRTTFIVKDAEAAASRYEYVFGSTRHYDDELAADARFPPVAPDGSLARLIMLQTEDPVIGMVGFLSYRDHSPEPHQGTMSLGSSVLVVATPDAAGLAMRASVTQGLTVTGPVEWNVPGHDGCRITLKPVSRADQDGLHFEASERILPEP